MMTAYWTCRGCTGGFLTDRTPESRMCDRCTPRPNALRYNTGKVDFTLVPLDALEAEARVWMAGEKKYGRDNWTKLWAEDTINVVSASTLRHLFALMRGETHDPETGETHAAHIRCNAAMLHRYIVQNTTTK
jgi:hypothetical protein